MTLGELIATLYKQARDHELSAEAYPRIGDDYNADHSEGQATKIYQQIEWMTQP